MATVGAALLFHGNTEVSTSGAVYFIWRFAHLCAFDLLICACVLPISVRIVLASHLLAGPALSSHSIPEVSSNGHLFFGFLFSHLLHVRSAHLHSSGHLLIGCVNLAMDCWLMVLFSLIVFCR